MPQKTPILAARVIRSLSESPAFRLSWRIDQINQYLSAADRAQADPRLEFALPPDENDVYIIDYYRFLRSGSAHFFDKEIRYVNSAVRSNRANGNAGRWRAMLIAGLSPEEIAPHYNTTPRNIEIFSRIFFDILPYRENEVWLKSAIFPHTYRPTVLWPGPMTEMTEEQLDVYCECVQKFWDSMAYRLGWNGLQRVLTDKVQFTAEQVNSMYENIRSVLTARCEELVVNDRGDNLPRPGDVMRLIEFNTSSADRGDSAGANKEAELRDGLINALLGVAKTRPDNDEIHNKLAKYIRQEIAPEELARRAAPRPIIRLALTDRLDTKPAGQHENRSIFSSPFSNEILEEHRP